ncbi:MAG: 2-amino-4-hydroxy-6-hydroxymethyldihydropteridine diphosphokinase, partial [Rhodanobacter sp.]
MSTHRWLLLLGSNLAQDQHLRDALERLETLGVASALTPVRQFPAQDGCGGAYFNALAELECDGSRDVLSRQLKQLEQELGRNPEDDGVVAIDIDILAREEQGRWLPDAHALA